VYDPERVKLLGVFFTTASAATARAVVLGATQPGMRKREAPTRGEIEDLPTRDRKPFPEGLLKACFG
jgi:hypothetical protein